MTNNSLTVLDHGEPIAISFADILKYHGRSFIGGAAHGFKAMQRAFPLLCADGRPERYEVTIATAFPGPGGRDAIEMATRSVTGGRYRSISISAGPMSSRARAGAISSASPIAAPASM